VRRDVLTTAEQCEVTSGSARKEPQSIIIWPTAKCDVAPAHREKEPKVQIAETITLITDHTTTCYKRIKKFANIIMQMQER